MDPLPTTLQAVPAPRYGPVTIGIDTETSKFVAEAHPTETSLCFWYGHTAKALTAKLAADGIETALTEVACWPNSLGLGNLRQGIQWW